MTVTGIRLPAEYQNLSKDEAIRLARDLVRNGAGAFPTQAKDGHGF